MYEKNLWHINETKIAHFRNPEGLLPDEYIGIRFIEQN